MAWDGYYALDGVEFINVARTEKYTEAVGWFRPRHKNDALQPVLGHAPYVDAETDPAPWIDERHPVSAEFYGVYPLDISGTEDSTQTADTLQGLGEGGVVTRPRNATKSIVFNVVLVAASEAGANYGHQWLKRVLAAAGCTITPSCNGHDLTYFASEPHIGPWDNCENRQTTPSSDPQEVADALTRRLRRSVCTVGPQITSKAKTTDGGAVWMVSFTLTAGRPVELGVEVPLLGGWLDPAEAGNPWPDNTAPPGAAIFSTAVDYTDEWCFGGAYVPVVDPLAPAIIAPPQPPGIEWGMFDPPGVWKRRRVVIPKEFIPAWTDVAPIVSLYAPAEIRNARIRFYMDPLETDDMPVGDDCDYVADFVVTFIPLESSMIIDGADRAIYLDVGGLRRRADSLVFGMDGGPFEWPTLTCGVQHIMTLDIPAAEDVPYVDLSFVERYI